MAKEQQYKEQMQAMGTYDPAFDGAIHQLCILERELSRARRQWSATTPSGVAPLFSHPLYGVITQLQRDILAHRDSLGLTPKGLKKLTGELRLGEAQGSEEDKTVLGFMLKKYETG